MPTEPQYVQAFAVGQRRRMARLKLRSEVRALSKQDGMRRAAELLLDPPEEILTLPVVDLLCWIRWVGPDRAQRLAARQGLTATRPVEKATLRQRRAVAAWLLEQSL